MARFIPSVKPDTFNNSYGEKKVYEALRTLNDQYTVFYSLRWVGIGANRTLGEADFVILHPDYGILVIEVKSGEIEYRDGLWIQTNTKTRSATVIQPFHQAMKSQFEILERLEHDLQEEPRPMLGYAVWFTSMDGNRLGRLPPEAAPEITLDKASLDTPEAAISAAFAYWGKKFRIFSLGDAEYQKVIDVLCPHFHAIPSLKSRMEEAGQSYIQMTRQQMMLLDFLDEQRTAAIHGPAGTGKTVLAVEKAKRLAAQGHRVLFLCYNSFLRNFLMKNNAIPNVDIHNAHSLAYDCLGHRDIPIEDLLSEFDAFLHSLHTADAWKYDSVIVDEGQDLDENLLSALFTFTKEKQGCFYVFYDRNQNILNRKTPRWIETAECRLVLHNNCRNTKEVFDVSCNMIGLDNRSTSEIHGDVPTFQFFSSGQDENEIVDAFLEKARAEGLEAEDIVILTAKTVCETAVSLDCLHAGYELSTGGEPGSVLFTTIRKFKGLEAEAVLIVDSSMSALLREEHRRLLYVGGSRARSILSVAMLEDVPSGKMGDYMRELSPGRTVPRNKKGIKRLYGAK